MDQFQNPSEIIGNPEIQAVTEISHNAGAVVVFREAVLSSIETGSNQ